MSAFQSNLRLYWIDNISPGGRLARDYAPGVIERFTDLEEDLKGVRTRAGEDAASTLRAAFDRQPFYLHRDEQPAVYGYMLADMAETNARWLLLKKAEKQSGDAVNAVLPPFLDGLAVLVRGWEPSGKSIEKLGKREIAPAAQFFEILIREMKPVMKWLGVPEFSGYPDAGIILEKIAEKQQGLKRPVAAAARPATRIAAVG